MKPLDVWLRILPGEEEADAEANTFLDDDGYRVDWYLNAVGLVRSERFTTRREAKEWLRREGFEDYST